MDTWLTSIRQSLKCLRFYHEAQNGTAGDGLSLVQIPPQNADETQSQFVLIQWSVVPKRGRIADVDEHNYVKCIVPVGRKKEPLKLDEMDARIIIPVTGAKVLRERRTSLLRSQANLNHLSDDMVRLLGILRAAQSHREDAGLGTSVVEICFLCKKGDDDDSIEVQAMVGSVTLCPLCLLGSHQRCRDKFHEHVDGILPSLDDILSQSQFSAFEKFEEAFLRGVRLGRGVVVVRQQLVVVDHFTFQSLITVMVRPVDCAISFLTMVDETSLNDVLTNPV